MNRRRAMRWPLVSLICALAACSSTTTTSISVPKVTASNADVQKRDPSSPAEIHRRASTRLQLAASYYQDGKYDVALDELRQALALEPNYADAHTVLALVYAELHEDALAEQSFQRALQIEPANSDLNNNYGWYLCQHGREKESLTYFEKALKNPLYAQKAKPLQNEGVCSIRMGDAAAAEEYFRRSFELDPSGAVSAYNLASIYYDRKDFARARFYVSQVNSGQAPSPASLWLGIRIERRLGNRNNQVALESQLERLFADSREAQMQKRGNYGD